jgi:hypothetical protein
MEDILRLHAEESKDPEMRCNDNSTSSLGPTCVR